MHLYYSLSNFKFDIFALNSKIYTEFVCWRKHFYPSAKTVALIIFNYEKFSISFYFVNCSMLNFQLLIELQ